MMTQFVKITYDLMNVSQYIVLLRDNLIDQNIIFNRFKF